LHLELLGYFVSASIIAGFEIGIFFASALDIWDQIVHNNSRFSQNDLILFLNFASKRFD